MMGTDIKSRNDFMIQLSHRCMVGVFFIGIMLVPVVDGFSGTYNPLQSGFQQV
jgi:hypothetical protein